MSFYYYCLSLSLYSGERATGITNNYTMTHVYNTSVHTSVPYLLHEPHETTMVPKLGSVLHPADTDIVTGDGVNKYEWNHITNHEPKDTLSQNHVLYVYIYG